MRSRALPFAMKLSSRLIAILPGLALSLLLGGCAGVDHGARRAAFVGDLEQVKASIAKGANVNATYQNEGTPLHQAVMGNHPDIAAWLLANGANVDSKNQSGGTPLHTAAEQDRLKLAELLVSHKANPNEKSAFGETPLHLAASAGRSNLVAYLISKGADPNARRNDGRTPLHFAIFRNSVGTVQTLLDRGADVNAAFGIGVTPLHLAVENCLLFRIPTTSTPVIDLLLAAGARPTILPKPSWGPGSIATTEVMTAGSFAVYAQHLERSGDVQGAASHYEQAASIYDKIPKSLLVQDPRTPQDTEATRAILSGLSVALIGLGQPGAAGSLIGLELYPGALTAKEFKTFSKELAQECRKHAQRLKGTGTKL